MAPADSPTGSDSAASSADKHLEHLAERVRALRSQRGLSLGQLATISGVAKATLFKIEQRRTNPTLDTLGAVAEAFGVTIGDLITLPRRDTVEVVRAGDGQPAGDADTLVKSMMSGGVHVEIRRAELTPGPAIKAPRSAVGGWEHVFVLDGHVVIGPVDQQNEVGPGDYAMYPADVPHAYEVVGDTVASVWIITTNPRPASEQL